MKTTRRSIRGCSSSCTNRVYMGNCCSDTQRDTHTTCVWLTSLLSDNSWLTYSLGDMVLIPRKRTCDHVHDNVSRCWVNQQGARRAQQAVIRIAVLKAIGITLRTLDISRMSGVSWVWLRVSMLAFSHWKPLRSWPPVYMSFPVLRPARRQPPPNVMLIF